MLYIVRSSLSLIHVPFRIVSIVILMFKHKMYVKIHTYILADSLTPLKKPRGPPTTTAHSKLLDERAELVVETSKRVKQRFKTPMGSQ